jgi:hypothetical protein
MNVNMLSVIAYASMLIVVMMSKLHSSLYMLRIYMLRAIILSMIFAESHYAECRYGKCCYAEWYYVGNGDNGIV